MHYAGTTAEFRRPRGAGIAGRQATARRTLVPFTFSPHLSGMARPPPKPPKSRKSPKPPKPYVPFSPEVANRILVGLSFGLGLRELCEGDDMPTRPTVMRWLRERPAFARAVAQARAEGGLSGVGRPSGYSRVEMMKIYDRLCQGEPLRSICWDPAMPGRSTVHVWLQRHAEARDLVDLGRDVGAYAAADAVWHGLRQAGLGDLPAPPGAPLPARGRPREGRGMAPGVGPGRPPGIR